MDASMNPHISIDCVIFGFDLEKLNILLLERLLKDEQTGEIIIYDHTLAGNHIFNNEELTKAAERILKETTGLTNIYLEQFYTFGNTSRLSSENSRIWLKSTKRDPDIRVVSVGYYSLVNIKDAEITYSGRNATWFPIEEMPELAFDHDRIARKALEALRKKIKIEPIGFELLPDKFTISQVQKMYEAILGIEIDKRNFRKKISNASYIVPLNEKQIGVSHKPAQLYMFSREIYEKTRKENFLYNI